MPVDDDSASTNPFAISADESAKLEAIEQALLDPSPRRIGRLDQWGLADTYESYAEIAGYRELSIAMADGTLIDASLSVPRDAPAGTCPAILMPAPLSPLGRLSYLAMLPRWARGGYVVLTYSQRGLAKSGGEIHVAGPQDVEDAMEIVTTLSELDAVDPARIGCFGASYGAGTSLLLAGNDPRIKAVAGTSAWADLFASLYENGTRHLAAFEALVKLFKEDRCSEEFRDVIQKIRGNDIDDVVRAFAEARSPKNRLQAYNDHQVPILMTTAWHETIFSVPAVVDMFNRLTGPKSLLVQIGDHGNGELPGLAGLVSKPTEMAYRWMDHHLGGTAGDGATPSYGVRSEYMHNLLSDLHHDDWESYALPRRRFHLAHAAAGERDGRLTEGAPQSGWTRPVKVSVQNTEVVVAPKLIETGLAERMGLPHVYRTAEVDRGLAAIWTTEPLERPMRVQGELELRVTVTPQALDATIVAYLMDCDPATGRAAIITNAPVTVSNEQPGRATTVTVHLQPAHYVLNKGRRLQLIIDTHDPFYADANRAPSAIELSSPQDAPSYVDIPLHPLS
ncbi:prolyl oligopeptidase family serine peptidase [Streptomyces sp. NBC_00250]|uniref:CocE/NonD family hydrolase n=1 Tax=Streptomyces sp. NBC_00250 TaxID=2903641 RepID=UPI002E2B7F20|nr:CocE/NonD family hydrolase [Streptomyces sp. NBC_00250]